MRLELDPVPEISTPSVGATHSMVPGEPEPTWTGTSLTITGFEANGGDPYVPPPGSEVTVTMLMGYWNSGQNSATFGGPRSSVPGALELGQSESC
jgi:hypothetical protein